MNTIDKDTPNISSDSGNKKRLSSFLVISVIVIILIFSFVSIIKILFNEDSDSKSIHPNIKAPQIQYEN